MARGLAIFRAGEDGAVNLDWVCAPGGAISTYHFSRGAGCDLATLTPDDVALVVAYLARWYPTPTIPHSLADVLAAARAANRADAA